MAAHGHRLRLRLFLEGVEVPVISAQIQGLPNAPLMAAIQIVPIPEGTRLPPRTLVHLYFLDSFERDSVAIPKRSAGPSSQDQSDPSLQEQEGYYTQRELRQQDNNTYKLLFCGEVLGFDWSKDQAQRALVLQCSDLSNYWDYAYQWTNTGLFGPGLKALFSGGSTNLFTDFLSSKAEVLTNILRTPSIGFPQLKGLAGGIIHLLEAIGGSYAYEKKIAGQNIFFTLAELRLRVTQMIMALEQDPTASRLLANQGYAFGGGGLFNRLLGGMGGQTSIRKSINALTGIIFHETYAQPCPRYIPGGGGSVSGETRQRISDNPSTSFLAVGAQTIIREARGVLATLRPSEEDAQFVALPNIAGNVRSSMIAKLRAQQRTLKNFSMRLRGLQPSVPTASGLLTSASQQLGIAATRLSAWQPTNERSIARVEEPIQTAIEKLSRIPDLSVVTSGKKNKQPARLAQQILRPDVWFSAPPRCNVLFPEHYNRLSFRRQFMEEPTRLLLKTNDEFFGEDELFDRFYFAPKTSSVKKGKANLQALLRNDILEHELFTGILPVFEKMGELNIFSVRGGITTDKVPQVGLAQRSANFLYFKYRFAARQMTVSGRFNPYLALGFPALVIDKYVDIPTLERHNALLKEVGRPTREINKLLGTHFLGNLTQVTYSVSQNSGSMDAVLSYARQPDESVEFLGATDLKEVSVSQRFDQDALRVTDVAAIAPPPPQSMGPNLGRVRRVQEVTSLYRGDRGASSAEGATSSKPLLLFGVRPGQKPRSASSRKQARVPVGVEVDARDLPREVVDELGITLGTRRVQTRPAAGAGERISEQAQEQRQPAFRTVSVPTPVTIRVYRVEEEVPRYRQEFVELPAEEYIRPGWYGDVWHPAKIGQAYQEFFATGAITDPHTITDPQGPTTYATTNAAEESLEQAAMTDDGQDPRRTAPAAYMLREGASIEQAVGFLVATYSHIKHSGYDIEDFIRAYTWRPIATLTDMFGTTDLQLDATGAQVVQGVEGFHSRAFGPYSDLFGLVVPEIEEVVGVRRGTTAAQKGDTRKAKQDAVRDYIAGLGLTRGLLG